MTPRFVFHEAAREELREAHTWYDVQRADLGAEFGQVISATLDRIANHPQLYPEVMTGLRRAVLSRFPYSIFYHHRANVIRVLAVLHHRRDPAVWRGRAAE